MHSLLGNIIIILLFCHIMFTFYLHCFSSSSIRLELLNRLNDLGELKIRSVSGLALEHGLQVFSHLHKLKTLVLFNFPDYYFQFFLSIFVFFFQSLTTLTNLPSSELSHLDNLTQLESLEIGHCVSWSSAADYEMLSKLQHLRHLRIEQGPSVGILQYLEASLSGLCHLQHLEIVNFTFDTQIQELKLTNLKRLLIIPKYSNEVITTFSVRIFKLRNFRKLIISSFFLDFGNHDPKCV